MFGAAVYGHSRLLPLYDKSKTTMENERIIKSERCILGEGENKITRAMLYEQGPVGSEILFMLKCHNIPVGSEVSFECPELGPQPPIVVQPTPVTGPDFSVGMHSYVPANFAGTIYYSVVPKGTLPPDAWMQMMAMFPAEMGA